VKKVVVEWMHLEKDEKTCDRCDRTGQEVQEVVSRLNAECGPKDVQIERVETKLTGSEIERSNLVLVNGIPIENLLPNAEASKSHCSSCGDLTGKDESCRTIVQLGAVYESIPQRLIRAAVCQEAGCC